MGTFLRFSPIRGFWPRFCFLLTSVHHSARDSLAAARVLPHSVWAAKMLWEQGEGCCACVCVESRGKARQSCHSLSLLADIGGLQLSWVWGGRGRVEWIRAQKDKFTLVTMIGQDKLFNTWQRFAAEALPWGSINIDLKCWPSTFGSLLLSNITKQAWGLLSKAHRCLPTHLFPIVSSFSQALGNGRRPNCPTNSIAIMGFNQEVPLDRTERPDLIHGVVSSKPPCPNRFELIGSSIFSFIIYIQGKIPSLLTLVSHKRNLINSKGITHRGAVGITEANRMGVLNINEDMSWLSHLLWLSNPGRRWSFYMNVHVFWPFVPITAKGSLL